MELTKLIDAEKARREKELNTTYATINRYEAEIMNGKNVEQNLIWLKTELYANNRAYEASTDKHWVDALKKDFELFQRMSSVLKSELDATVKDDKISFRGIGKSISFNVKLIAAMFDLHPGMFGFDSSFSCHEAYTETNRLIHIGISGDDTNIIIIDFHFINDN